MTMTASRPKTSRLVSTKALPRHPNQLALVVSGRTVAVLGRETVRALRVGPTTKWTTELRARIAAIQAEAKARECALSMLARRASTRHELARGLRQRKVASATAQRVLNGLARDGWIDDEQCAAGRVAHWERTYTGARAKSGSWMVAKLVAAGIDDAVAERTVARTMNANTEARSAEQALAAALKAGRSLRVALASLSRRGFSPEILEDLAARHELHDVDDA